MRLLSERHQAHQVAAKWAAQYPKDRLEIRAKLEALDPETATASQIAEIIGNTSWCEPQRCGECEKTAWNIVQVGEEPPYESSTAYLCADCLRIALAIATGEA